MKKILITGTNGLLGQKIVYALLNRKDIQVIATSRGENRILKKEGYIYEPLDITDKQQTETVLNKYLPNVVINCAAMTNVDACETKREEAYAQNVTGVKNIVGVLENQEARGKNQEASATDYNPHLIHLSTDFIFDGKNGPYKEEDTPNPLSYYAETKLEGEKIVMASKLKWAIARTIIIYGVTDGMSRSNIVLWAREALMKGQKINVVNDQFRSPTLAEDLADGCIKIADKGATGIYHLSGPDTMSIIDLVNRVADFFKLDKSIVNPVTSDSLNQPAKRPPRTGFIIDKAKMDLGYDPKRFEEGLAVVKKQLENNS